MNYLISESQLSLFVESENKISITDNLNRLYSFTKSLVDNTKKNFGINLTLLLTWGSSVGGLVLPLDNFIRTGNFDLTEQQITLILIGCVASLILNNKELEKEVFQRCKEEGILKILKEVLIKGKILKVSFQKFMDSLNFSIKDMSTFMSYAFLIPIINDIQMMVQDNSDINSIIVTIIKRIIASGVVTLSSDALIEIIKKIVSRVK